MQPDTWTECRANDVKYINNTDQSVEEVAAAASAVAVVVVAVAAVELP